MRAHTASSVLTEKQETDEIAALLDHSSDYLCNNDDQDYETAAALVDEALQIDGTNVAALTKASKIALVVNKYERSLWCADHLMELYPDDPLGKFLRGETEAAMRHHREAIDVLLTSMDMKYPDVDSIASLIVKATAGVLSLSEEFSKDLEGLDYYTKLGEVSIALLHAREHMLVIRILDSALKLQSNKHGVSMRIHLTRGHALCATRQLDDAMRSYEQCFELALSIHDITHQTKALVNMGALLLSRGETYQAVVMYERLLDLHSQILSDQLVCEEDMWTDHFVGKLYMNTSMAYKSVGNMDRALHYAKEYFNHCTMENSEYNTDVASAHKHLGILYEIIQDYPSALDHLKKNLGMVKCSGDRQELGCAYGYLGSLYSRIGLWQLSIVYHERHINIATQSEHKQECVLAYDMYGDSLMRRGNTELACEMYKLMQSAVGRKNTLNRCTALYKLGNSHASHGHTQHALHYYDEALSYCEPEYTQLLRDIQFGIARTAQMMTDSRELDRGRKLLDQSIETLKKQIEECLSERKYLSQHYLTQLNEAYEGMQLILSKLGCDAECLEYAENFRIYRARLLSESPNPRLPTRLDLSSILTIMSRQGATVVYYSFIGDSLLIWLLKPSQGLVRFYMKRPSVKDRNAKSELESILAGWYDKLDRNRKVNMYKMEKRHLERPTSAMKAADREIIGKTDREAVRRAKSTTQQERQTLKSAAPIPRESTISATDTPVESAAQQMEKKLYKFLLSPVDDLLSDLDLEGHLIVIPDQMISTVPFSQLRDLKGKQLKTKFNITVLPGFYAMDMIMKNEVYQLQCEDEVICERNQSCRGGLYKYFVSPEMKYTGDESVDQNKPNDGISGSDSRKITHPRLSSVVRNENMINFSRKVTPAERLDLDFRSSMANEERNTTKFVQLENEGIVMSRAESTPPNFYSYANPCSPRRSKCQHSKQKPAVPVPQPAYHTFRPTRGQAADVHRLLRTRDVSTLISKSSTGTDALTSNTSVPEYRQVSRRDNFAVIGNPALHTGMKFGNSCVKTTEAFASKAMDEELRKVSEILGCDIISGINATKETFLKTAVKATLLHIVTFGSLASGFLLMSCEKSRKPDSMVDEKYYLVTCEDIMKLKIRAKLVVISSGWKHENLTERYLDQQSLPVAFICAGAQAVMTVPYPQQSTHLLQFYRHFYSHYQCGGRLCTAVNDALEKVTEEKAIPTFPVCIYGKNISLNIISVKSAMLDQRLDEVESEIMQEMITPPLNTPSPSPLPSREDQLCSIQICLSSICEMKSGSLTTLGSLISLVEDASKLVLQAVTEVPNIVTLPLHTASDPPSLQLLKLLHFHFLPRGETVALEDPAVLFPSSDPDNLLEKSLYALMALQGICQYENVCQPLADCLPMSQDNISSLVDLFAITKHSPQIQLRTTDETVQTLWSNNNCRVLLGAVGFQQVGSLLHFKCSRDNEELLAKCLQLFIMMSTHKSATLLYKLDIAELNTSSSAEREEAQSKCLPTILPVLLPKDQLTKRVPWASRLETEDEMSEKMALARRYWSNSKHFEKERRNAKTIHRSTAAVQAAETLEKYALPAPKATRVKVKSGMTASRNRVTIDYIAPVTTEQMHQRRKYSDFILNTRLKDIDKREDFMTKQLYRSYTDIIN